MSISVISPDWFVMDRLSQSWQRFSHESLCWHASLAAWEKRTLATDLLIFDAHNPVSLGDLTRLKRLAYQIPTLLLHAPDLASDDIQDPAAPWVPVSIDADVDSLRVAAVAARLRSQGTLKAAGLPSQPPALQRASGPVSIEARMGRWMDILTPTSPLWRRDSRDATGRLRDLTRLEDLSALLSNRLPCRRQMIRLDEILRQLESRGLPVQATSLDGNSALALRIDLQHTLRSIDEVLAAIGTLPQLCDVMLTDSASACELRIVGREPINGGDFAALAHQWSEISWPDFDGSMEFTAGLGLSRERLRCQGGDLGLLRDAQGRFGFRLSLPKNEPAAYLPGFVSHLRRRLEYPGTEIGFFLVQEPRTDIDLGELLAPWLGSCGWIQPRGELAWSVIAPIGRSEVTDFFEALGEYRRQALEARGSGPASPTPFEASVVAHVRIEEDLARWLEAFEATRQQANSQVTHGPIVVLAHETSPWIQGLAARLSDSGGEVVQASVVEPCDSAGDDPAALEASTVLDLRRPQAADWNRLEHLVEEGLLHRRIYLLTDDLRRQNDRLASWVESWGDRTPRHEEDAAAPITDSHKPLQDVIASHHLADD